MEYVRNNTDKVDPKYWDKNVLQCHILYTQYPRWNTFELKPDLRFRLQTARAMEWPL